MSIAIHMYVNMYLCIYVHVSKRRFCRYYTNLHQAINDVRKTSLFLYLNPKYAKNELNKNLRGKCEHPWLCKH